MNRESYKFSLTAEVDTELPDGTLITEIPVKGFSSLWAKNEIPKAYLVVPVGREFGFSRLGRVEGEATLFQTEEGILAVQNGLKVRVYGNFQLRDSMGEFPRQALLPEGSGTDQTKFTIFDGYIEGYSFQVDTSGAALLTLVLEHWLSDLDNASAAHPSMHPSNPSSFLFPTVNAGTGTFNGPAFTDSATIKNFVTASTLAADLWAGDTQEEGIRGYLRRVATGDLLEGGRIFGDIDELREFSNGPAVQAALDAFEPLPGDGQYKFGTPLQLDTSSETYLESLLYSVSSQCSLSAESLQALGSQTTWGSILRYAANYLLAVIPLVGRALVVPYFPANRKFFRTIPDTQIYSFVKNVSNPNPLKGVAVYGGRRWEAGPDVVAGQGINEKELSLGGYYINENQRRGVLLFVQAPPWMAGPVPSQFTKGSGANGGAQAVGTAANPGAGQAPAAASPAQVMTDYTTLSDKFAKAVYFSEYTKERSIDISGPLRFDICPGSILRVYPPKEAFTNEDYFGVPLLGCVESVAIRISIEDARPTTSFRLSHIRSEAENDNTESVIPDKNPIWSSSWLGAPLIEELPPPE